MYVSVEKHVDELQRDGNQLRCVGAPDKVEECFKSILADGNHIFKCNVKHRVQCAVDEV